MTNATRRLLILLLAAIGLWEIFKPIPSPALQLPQKPLALVMPSASLPSASLTESIRNHPLFITDRLPLPTEPPALAAQNDLLWNRYRIEGSIQSRNFSRLMLRDTLENRSITLKPGESLGEWQLNRLDQTTAFFRKDDETRTFTLDTPGRK